MIYNTGDKVRINNRSEYTDLIGKEGLVIDVMEAWRTHPYKVYVNGANVVCTEASLEKVEKG